MFLIETPQWKAPKFSLGAKDVISPAQINTFALPTLIELCFCMAVMQGSCRTNVSHPLSMRAFGQNSSCHVQFAK